MFSQVLIIDSLEAFGFKVNKQGICFGISHCAADLIVSKQFQQLKRLIDLITKNLSPYAVLPANYQIILVKPGQWNSENCKKLLGKIQSEEKFVIITLGKEKINAYFVENKKIILKNNELLKVELTLNLKENDVLKQIMDLLFTINNPNIFVKADLIPNIKQQMDYFLKKILNKTVEEKNLNYFLIQKLAYLVGKRNREVVQQYKNIKIEGKTKEEHLKEIKENIFKNETQNIEDNIKKQYLSSSIDTNTMFGTNLSEKIEEKINEITEKQFNEKYAALFLQKQITVEEKCLNKEERDLLQLKPFYYAIAIHQNVYTHYNKSDHSGWFLNKLEPTFLEQNAGKSFPLVQSNTLAEITKNNNLSRNIEEKNDIGILLANPKNPLLASYDSNKICIFLLRLSQLFQEYQFSEPWACVLKGSKHCITVGFDPATHIWEFIDPNQDIREFNVNDSEIAKQVIAAFSKNAITNLAIDIYVANNQQGQKAMQAVNAFIETNDWQSIYQFPVSNNQTKDSEGGTLLFSAAQWGNTSLVERLLKEDSNIDPNQMVNNNATSLHMATINGHTDVVALLLAHKGINPNITYLGYTALFIAAQNGNVPMIKELLNHPQINPDSCSGDFTSVLFVAAENGQAEIVKLLLNHPNIQDPHAPRKDQVTPVGIAARQGHPDVVKLLLQHGANPNTTLDIQTKENLLQWATSNNHVDIVELIQEKNAEKNKLKPI